MFSREPLLHLGQPMVVLPRALEFDVSALCVSSLIFTVRETHKLVVGIRREADTVPRHRVTNRTSVHCLALASINRLLSIAMSQFTRVGRRGSLRRIIANDCVRAHCRTMPAPMGDEMSDSALGVVWERHNPGRFSWGVQ